MTEKSMQDMFRLRDIYLLEREEGFDPVVINRNYTAVKSLRDDNVILKYQGEPYAPNQTHGYGRTKHGDWAGLLETAFLQFCEDKGFVINDLDHYLNMFVDASMDLCYDNSTLTRARGIKHYLKTEGKEYAFFKFWDISSCAYLVSRSHLIDMANELTIIKQKQQNNSGSIVQGDIRESIQKEDSYRDFELDF